MNELSLARKEMDAYCKYLVGKNADPKSLDLFVSAIQHEATMLSLRELKLLGFMVEHPWIIGFIDAAVGIFHPTHRLRKRMIVAFAILETNPLYFSFFGPQVFGPFYFVTLILLAVREGLMAIVGSLILLFF